MFHQNIRLSGVYIFNDNASLSRGMQGAPIYSTMTMNILGMNNANNRVLVFPKYKVIFYDSGNTIATTHDNTSGTKCLFAGSSNNASSCKVYYDNVEITNVFSTTGT